MYAVCVCVCCFLAVVLKWKHYNSVGPVIAELLFFG